MSDFRLADELFLIGHNEYSGKATVNDEVLDTGLAGAALGELLLQRRLDFHDNKIVVTDPRPWGELVSDAILAEVQRKGETFVARAWVEHLRGEVREVLARRLAASGLIRREETRAGITRRVHVRYPAVDPIVCARPLVSTSYLLGRPELLDAQTATLAGLLLATGLDQLITLNMNPKEVRDHITATVERLPMQMKSLVAGVDAAIAAMALTIRR